MSGNSQRSYIARGTILPARFVIRDTATNHGVLQCTAGQNAVGISYEGTRAAPLPGVTPQAAIVGENVLVYTDGMPCEVVAGGVITAGDRLKPDADGAAVTAAIGEVYSAVADANATAGQNCKVTVTTERVYANEAGFAGVLVTTQQALSGAGAINVTTYFTAWTTTAAQAGTLANGTFTGQRKAIQLVTDGGDGTLTPTSLSGGTTIVFSNVGDRVELVWNGTAWVVVERVNVATGSAATPVLA
jgi:hypothetical protein